MPDLPSEVGHELSFFDRFATWASNFVSRALFFVACVLIVVLWLPSYFLVQTIDTWQLIINTLTTIVTFLLVALLQNTQNRADQATQHKLNAIAKAVADVMEENEHLDAAREELRAAVGLERRESA